MQKGGKTICHMDWAPWWECIKKQSGIVMVTVNSDSSSSRWDWFPLFMPCDCSVCFNFGFKKSPLHTKKAPIVVAHKYIWKHMVFFMTSTMQIAYAGLLVFICPFFASRRLLGWFRLSLCNFYLLVLVSHWYSLPTFIILFVDGCNQVNGISNFWFAEYLFLWALLTMWWCSFFPFFIITVIALSTCFRWLLSSFVIDTAASQLPNLLFSHCRLWIFPSQSHNLTISHLLPVTAKFLVLL